MRHGPTARASTPPPQPGFNLCKPGSLLRGTWPRPARAKQTNRPPVPMQDSAARATLGRPGSPVVVSRAVTLFTSPVELSTSRPVTTWLPSTRAPRALIRSSRGAKMVSAMEPFGQHTSKSFWCARAAAGGGWPAAERDAERGGGGRGGGDVGDGGEETAKAGRMQSWIQSRGAVRRGTTRAWNPSQSTQGRPLQPPSTFNH